MKRKHLVAVALAVLAMFALTSCNTTAPTPAPTTTPQSFNPDDYDYNFALPDEEYDFGGRQVVIYSYHGQDFEQREDFIRRYVLDDIIETRYNVDIVYDLDYLRGANDAMVGRPTIDIGFLGLHVMYVFYNGGSIEPWDPYFEELHYTGESDIRWDAQVTEWNSMPGGTYGMGVTAYELWKYHNVYAMFMNKTLLEQRNIDPEEIYSLQENKEWTWAKFAEYAGKVTADINHDDIPDVYGTAMNGDAMLTGLMTSARTNYIQYNDQTKEFTFETDDKLVSVIEFMSNLLVSGAARGVGAMNATNENIDIQDFMDSKIGFYPYIFQRTWQAGYFSEMSDEYGVLCFPMAPGENEYYIPDNCNGGWALYAHPDEADKSELAKFLYLYKTPIFDVNDPSDESTAFWTEANNRINDDGSRYFLELVEAQTNVVRNNNVTFLSNGLYTTFNLDPVWIGAMTVSEALQSCTPQCQEFMKTFYNKAA